MRQEGVIKLTSIKDKLNRYSARDLIHVVTEEYWKLFVDKQNPLSDPNSWERKFSTSSPWLCFIALGCDNQTKENEPLCQDSIKELTNEMWGILYYPSTWDFNKNFIIDFVDNFSNIYENYLAFLGAQEQKNVLKTLSSKEELYEVIRNIPPEFHVRTLNREIGTKYSDLPILASLFLCQEFEKDLKDEAVKAKKIDIFYSDFITKMFGMNSSRDFHQTFHLISEIALKNNGHINLHTLDLDSSTKEKISTLLKNLSCCATTIRADYDKFETHFLKNEILALNSNPFYLKPFFMMGDKNVFLCPSPHILLYTMSWLFIDLFLQYIQKINSDVALKELNSINKTIGRIIGLSYQRYIEKLLIHYKYTFFNLDLRDTREKILKDDTTSHADFTIETDEYYFILELKNSLGFNKHHEDIRISLLARWNRIAIGLNQTISTQNNLKNIPEKPVFHLVVVNESVTVESATFLLYHSRAKINSLSPGEFSIISSAQFENLISGRALDHFAKTCKKNSKTFSTSSFDLSDPKNIKEMCLTQNLLFEPYQDIDLTFWDEERCRLLGTKEEIT